MGHLLHDLHGHEDIRSRNGILAQILLLVPLGAFVAGAGGPHGQAFAVTASVLFLLLAFLWWRVNRLDTPEFSRPSHLYVGITFALAVGFAASAPLAGGARLILWAGLSALYLGSVAIVFALVPGQFGETVVVTDSLNERCGLLVIIVLGETVTGVVSGVAADPTNGHKLAIGIVGILVGFGAWWTYFDFVGHRPPRDTRAGPSWCFSSRLSSWSASRHGRPLGPCCIRSPAPTSSPRPRYFAWHSSGRRRSSCASSWC